MRLFTPILILLTSVIAFFMVVDPLRQSVSSLSSDIGTYNAALDNSTSLQKTEDTLLASYKNISQDDKDRLEHFLPNTVDNIKFILEIESIANKYGMSIKNIKFETPISASGQAVSTAPNSSNSGLVISSDPKSALPYGNFSIEFDTTGSYSSFLSFMKEVERNLRLVDIQSVNFTVPASATPTPGATDPSFDYSLKVETYWLK